jgi:hypothetical protein
VVRRQAGANKEFEYGLICGLDETVPKVIDVRHISAKQLAQRNVVAAADAKVVEWRCLIAVPGLRASLQAPDHQAAATVSEQTDDEIAGLIETRPTG